MLHPTRFLIGIAAIPAVLSLALLIDGRFARPLLALDTLAVALAAADGVLAWAGRRRLTVEVATAPTWSLGRRERLQVSLAWTGRRRLRLSLVPDVPPDVRLADMPHRLELPPRSRAEVGIEAVPQERGTIALAGAHCAVVSPLGLWHHHARRGAAQRVHVYPDLRRIADWALLARTDRLALVGVRRSRRVGGDTEFERLRDWHSDDAIGRMDWRATARRDALTVRDYQTSQSQRILLLIDAGRMLTTTVGIGDGLRTLLDLAIDAALLLAWTAVRQGDRVGLLAYADGVKRWLPPRGGPRQVTDLIHALHDLEAAPVESRHEDAFLHLERRERKRSLVVVMTHVLDEVNAAHLERHARLIGGRHLPLIVLLRDPDLHGAVPPRDAPPADDAGFWRAAAAATIVTWRSGVVDRLRGAGALVIDCAPERLTAEVVSGYLELKAKHLL